MSEGPDYASAAASIWGNNPWFQQMRAHQQMAQFPLVPIVTMPLADYERREAMLKRAQDEIHTQQRRIDELTNEAMGLKRTLECWRQAKLLPYFKKFKFVALSQYVDNSKNRFAPVLNAATYEQYSPWIRCQNAVWQIIPSQKPGEDDVVIFRLHMAVKDCKPFEKIRVKNIDPIQHLESGLDIPVNVFAVPNVLPVSLFGLARAATDGYKRAVAAEKATRTQK